LRSLDRISPRELGVVLLCSFAITIASFLASTFFADRAAHGLLRSAASIANDAGPAVSDLAYMRSALRRLEAALDDCVEVPGSARAESEIRDQRRAMGAVWDRYMTLPPYPGERDRWPGVAAELQALDVSVDRVLLEMRDEDQTGARVTLRRETRPAFDRVDARLGDLVDFNVQSTVRLATRVRTLRRASRYWEVALDAISAVFAAIAAVTALSLTRRYSRLMEQRVSELDHFAGRVAHDIRGPLSSVGLALSLTESKTDDPRILGILGRGSRSLRRVGQLVDDLLVFAHAGAPPTGEARANVAEVIRGVVEEMLPVAEEKDVELRCDPVEPGEVACSAGVLTSLVSNLVGNAIKYMGDAPIRGVVIRARSTGSRIRVEVEDTGPGVPEELQQRIFDPYVRGPEPTAPGFGLGLATVRRLAEAHGGAVGVEPRETGSLFWFELPKPRQRLLDHELRLGERR
jgi:signal transduction histidine kinase